MSRTVVGLVGGIASGKSAVADLVAASRPAVRIDADTLVHRVLERPAVARRVAERFPGCVDAEGRVDREALARVVFRDEAALRDLEAVVHPPVREAVRRAVERARAPLVLLDAALLQETGADALCDVVVYVACPARVRRARARLSRGWTEDEHRAREARQWPVARKRAHADLVVDNGDGLTRTRREVRRALQEIETVHATA